MDTLIAETDYLFKKELTVNVYEAHRTFYGFQKPEILSISNYTIKFNKKFSKSIKYKMALLDSVLALKLLFNANRSSTMSGSHNCIHDYRSAVQEYKISFAKDIWWK